MYMGYISNNDQNNPEAIGEKKEKEPTPEEIAAGNQREAEWNAALGVEAVKPVNFSESMANVVPFPGAAEATIAGAAAGAVLDAAASIGETPNAESNMESNSNIPNADNENMRTPATVTEAVAKQQIESNDIDVGNLVQNVAGTTPGGEEAIISDATAARTNITQAESAANSLATKIAAGESDGSVEGEDVLNAAMVSAANMSVATEKAATNAINEHPDTESSIAGAESAIEQAESAKESLAQAANDVKNSELAAKMQTGLQDIEAELVSKKDLLTETTETMAQKAEKAEEAEEDTKKEAAQNAATKDIAAESMATEQPQEQQDKKPEAANIEYAPGQMNVEVIKNLAEKRE